MLASTALTQERGTLSFTTGSDGRHDLCVAVGGRKRDGKAVAAVPSSGDKPIVIEMYLQRGHSSGYYEEMAAKEHLDRLELEVGD